MANKDMKMPHITSLREMQINEISLYTHQKGNVEPMTIPNTEKQQRTGSLAQCHGMPNGTASQKTLPAS